MFTDEEIREIASNYFHQSGHSLIACGENEGVNIAAEVLAFARDLLAANAGKLDALPISSGYALENFAVWIVQELHPMSESRETVERLLHAYMHDTAKPQPSQHNESE